MGRAQFFGQRRLVLPARDRHRVEAHLGRVLHSQVTQAAETVHTHHITGPRSTVP